MAVPDGNRYVRGHMRILVQKTKHKDSIEAIGRRHLRVLSIKGSTRAAFAII